MTVKANEEIVGYSIIIMTTPNPEKLPLPADVKTALEKLTSPNAKADAVLLLADKYLIDIADVRTAIVAFLSTDYKKGYANLLVARTRQAPMLLDILVERNTPSAELIETALRFNQHMYAIDVLKKAGKFRKAGDIYAEFQQWKDALECYLQADDAFFELAECLTHMPVDFVITDMHKFALLKAAKTNGDIKLRANYARLAGDKELLRKIYFEEISQYIDGFELEKIFQRAVADFPEEREEFGEKILKRIPNPLYAKSLADKLGFAKLSKQFAKQRYDAMKNAGKKRGAQDDYIDSERGGIAEAADQFSEALGYYEKSKQYRDAIRMAIRLNNDKEVQRLVAKALSTSRAHPVYHAQLAEALLEAKSPLAKKWLVKAMEYAERKGNLEHAASFARLAGDARADLYEVIFAAAKSKDGS